VALALEKLSCSERLKRRSFLKRYKGEWKNPERREEDPVVHLTDEDEVLVEEVLVEEAFVEDVLIEEAMVEEENNLECLEEFIVKDELLEVEEENISQEALVPMLRSSLSPPKAAPENERDLEKKCIVHINNMVKVGVEWCSWRRRHSSDSNQYHESNGIWPSPKEPYEVLAEFAAVAAAGLPSAAGGINAFLKDNFPGINQTPKIVENMNTIFDATKAANEICASLLMIGEARDTMRRAMRRPFCLDAIVSSYQSPGVLDQKHWLRPNLTFELILTLGIFLEASAREEHFQSSPFLILSMEDVRHAVAAVFPIYRFSMRFKKELRLFYQNAEPEGIVLNPPTEFLANLVSLVTPRSVISPLCSKELAEALRKSYQIAKEDHSSPLEVVDSDSSPGPSSTVSFSPKQIVTV